MQLYRGKVGIILLAISVKFPFEEKSATSFIVHSEFFSSIHCV